MTQVCQTSRKTATRRRLIDSTDLDLVKLAAALTAIATDDDPVVDQAPAGIEVEREMAIRLDERNRPEPDVLVTKVPFALSVDLDSLLPDRNR